MFPASFICSAYDLSLTDLADMTGGDQASCWRSPTRSAKEALLLSRRGNGDERFARLFSSFELFRAIF